MEHMVAFYEVFAKDKSLQDPKHECGISECVLLCILFMHLDVEGVDLGLLGSSG